MTHKEKVEACKKYKAKLAMTGKKDLAENLFHISYFEVKVDLGVLAKIQGYPKNLRIPDFVDVIG